MHDKHPADRTKSAKSGDNARLDDEHKGDDSLFSIHIKVAFSGSEARRGGLQIHGMSLRLRQAIPGAPNVDSPSCLDVISTAGKALIVSHISTSLCRPRSCQLTHRYTGVCVRLQCPTRRPRARARPHSSVLVSPAAPSGFHLDSAGRGRSL